jgi:hypothetical protein
MAGSYRAAATPVAAPPAAERPRGLRNRGGPRGLIGVRSRHGRLPPAALLHACYRSMISTWIFAVPELNDPKLLPSTVPAA